jgi:hypothetical protein
LVSFIAWRCLLTWNEGRLHINNPKVSRGRDQCNYLGSYHQCGQLDLLLQMPSEIQSLGVRLIAPRVSAHGLGKALSGGLWNGSFYSCMVVMFSRHARQHETWVEGGSANMAFIGPYLIGPGDQWIQYYRCEKDISGHLAWRNLPVAPNS